MFCVQGSGKEMLQELYDPISRVCMWSVAAPNAREAFVPKVPVRGVADLKGLKIRSL